MAQAFTNPTNMKFTEADIGKKVIGNIRASVYNITNTGWVGVIMNVLQNGTIGIVGDDCTEYYVEPECFDLLEPETKYKVGDRVKSTYSSTIGEVGTIVEIGTINDKNQIYIVDGFSYGSPIEYNGKNMNEYAEMYLEPIVEDPSVSCDWALRGPLGGISTTWSNVTAEAPVLTKSTLDRMVYATHTQHGENCFSKIYKEYEEMVDATKHSVIGKPYIESDLFIKTNKYKDMNIIDKIRVNIKGEPMKTLIKNEILTLDERLTNTGKELFMDFLYAKFKDEFVADLAPKLEGLNDDK